MSTQKTVDVRIDFPDGFRDGRCVSTGRNGSLQTTGIEVYEIQGVGVALTPITSRGTRGNCRIEIAYERKTLEQVAQALLDVAAKL